MVAEMWDENGFSAMREVECVAGRAFYTTLRDTTMSSSASTYYASFCTLSIYVLKAVNEAVTEPYMVHLRNDIYRIQARRLT